MEPTERAVDQHEMLVPSSRPRDPKGLVVGVAFRIPGASNFQELSSVMESSKSREAAKKKHIDQFGTIDVNFFKISPNEAYKSSPIMGTMLEVVAECIMDSGIRLNVVTSRKTGMYFQSNVPDSYMELTCNVAHYFNFKGPVLDFVGLDAFPTTAVHTALLDLLTGRCEFAVVIGVHTKRRSTGYHIGHRQQESGTDGVVAILIMSPHLKSKIVSRVHCDIMSASFKDISVSNDHNAQSVDPSVQLYTLTPETEDENQSKTKLPCSDILQEMFKGADSISVLMGVIAAIYFEKMGLDVASSVEGNKDGNSTSGQEFMGGPATRIVSVHLHTQTYDIVLWKPKIVSNSENKEVHIAALIPTTTHPFVDISEAENSLNMYQNDPSFLTYLVNSDLCKGFKGQLHPFSYYFKLPVGSYISKQDFTIHGEMPVTVVFDDFIVSPWKPSSDFRNLPVIDRSISTFDQILRDETGCAFSVLDLVASSCVPETTELGGITTRVACQIAVVDLLKAVNSMEDINSIQASGLGVVAASYADGALTINQAVNVAVILENALLTAAKSQEEQIILDVICSTDEVYQLGPWVQVFGHQPLTGFRISAPLDKRERLVDHIVEKGFDFKVHSTRVPVFSTMFRTYLDGLGTSLSDIIPTSCIMSSKVEVLGFSGKETKQVTCSSSFFVDLLCTPFDQEFKTLQKSELFSSDETTVTIMEKFETISAKVVTKPSKSESSNRASSAEEFEILDPAQHPENDDVTSSVRHSKSNRGVDENIMFQEGKTKTDVSSKKCSNLFLTPCKEVESVDCSTNAIRGSFLCSTSLPTESVSSMSELQSEGSSEYSKSQSSQANSETVLLERRVGEIIDERKTGDSTTLHLHIFNSPSDTLITSKDELEDSSIRTNVSSSSTLVYNDVHIHIDPNPIALLESLAWIHGTGNRMDAANQLLDVAPTHYQGDFVIHNLWRWNRQPCYQDVSALHSKIDKTENMTIYSLSPKPKLSEVVLRNLIVNRTFEHKNETECSNSDFSETIKVPVCPFDSSLLLLSGYKWNTYEKVLLPMRSRDPLVEDIKIQKQVRFSYRKRGFLGANSTDDDAEEEIQELSSLPNDNKLKLANDLQFGFADRGDLLGVLNCVKSEEFNFISLLQIDESLERYLMDMLYTFPLTSALHIFITPKLRATSTSKYVINISRRISTFGEEVVVALRDRCTDQIESCSSITKALSIISSFEEGIYDNYLARVFELPMFLDDGSFSIGRLEFMIFDHEIGISRIMYSDYDKRIDEEYSSSSTSSSSFDIEDYINEDAEQNGEENSSKGSGAEQERPSRERQSSPNMMTNFYLNFESTCVEALTKLSRINKHTMACVKPKPLCLLSDAELALVDDDADLCDEVLETDAPRGSKKEELMYLISVRCVPESQIFLYCKKPQEFSRWDTIKDVVEELKKRHPNLPITHEAFVSKCDEKIVPFEELLYEFLHDSTCDQKVEQKGMGQDQNVGSDKELKTCPKADSGQLEDDNNNNNPNNLDDNGNVQEKETLKTPFLYSKGFVIPDILISPPESDSVWTAYSSNNGLDESVCKIPKLVSNKVTDKQDHLEVEIENKEDFTFRNNVVSAHNSIHSDKSETVVRNENPEESGWVRLSMTSKGVSEMVEGNCVRESDTSTQQNIACTEELNEVHLIKIQPLVNLKSTHNKEEIIQPGLEYACEESSSQGIQSHNDSNKENTLLDIEPDIFDDFEHLKEPQVGQFENMASFKVTAVLVVHLMDRISSFHEQNGRAAGNMLLYVAQEQARTDDGERTSFLGIILFDDTDVRHSRFSLPYCFQDRYLETTLNYMLAWYIIRVLARISKDKAPLVNMIVQSPIQRDSAAIMLVASRLGCNKIVSSSKLEDLRDDLHSMVPRSVLLDVDLERSNVLPVVGKDGVDLAIMLRQQELNEFLDVLAPSGCLVLCGAVDRTKEISLTSIPRNGQIAMFDALSAAKHLTTMGDKDKGEFQQDLHNFLQNQDSQMDDCFPSSREGYFYKVLGQFSKSNPDEQPLEGFIQEMFFSTTRSLKSVFESVPARQWTMLGDVFEAMTTCPGDVFCPGEN